MKLLQTNSIRIGETEYPVKMTIRAMIEFEQITGHSISKIETLADITTIFFCVVKAGGAKLTYEQFMDLIDEHFEALTSFTDTVFEKEEKKT